MKQVKFARKWRNPVNATTVHEYPAGWSGVVSNETAERAVGDKVLDGDPVEAPEPKADKAEAKPKA